ncbi:hypothetical protein [Calothrix sp. 336/3]|uniref:hypothetical protein n=1 Tax=Calothrix sp. 336/3 TaxID=1337936 RepID=UPI00069B916F|nr:hypothetical protein [Calothrix sp. 336/3]
MKTYNYEHLTTKQSQIVTALVLSGILSLGSGLTFIRSAIAAPVPDLLVNTTTEDLPPSVARAVLQDISRREGVLASQLMISEYNQTTWRNGCLGAARPGEFCTQALVPGWQVVATDGNQAWTYHTNSQGRSVRLANSVEIGNKLPSSVRSAVVQAATRRLQVSSSRLQIAEAKQRTWGDSCLELAKPEELCNAVRVAGWQVVVKSDTDSLVYHTNRSGSLVRVNEKASESSDKKLPNRIRKGLIKSASRLTGVDETIFDISDAKKTRGGWRVTVVGNGQRLVYDLIRELTMGYNITLDKKASKTTLPLDVAQRVLIQAEEISRDRRDLKIISFQRQQWSNDGWQVTVGTKDKRWVFLSDSQGKRIELVNNNTPPDNGNLPNRVSNAVLRDASNWSGISTSRLKITKAEKQTWSNPCFLTFARVCNKAYIPTPGWIVTVNSDSQTWVYRVNEDASVVSLDRSPQMSTTAARMIKVDAARRARQEGMDLGNELRIIALEEKPDWDNSCGNERNCNRGEFGWQATVSNGRNSWVYRVKDDGSDYALAVEVNLPKNIANSVLADVAEETGKPVNQFRIVNVEKRQWSDSCLGVRRIDIQCVRVLTPGWQVTVSNGKQRWVYRVGESGAIALDEDAGNISIDSKTNPVPIPSSELPPPLESGIVFRQISSGGFTGATYETILLDDGRLIRVRMGDANDSERTVGRISWQKLQEFENLLQQKGFGEFSNMKYPADRGADYITYTLTSRDGTIQYNDISQKNLPPNLRSLVSVWNLMVNDVQAQGY